MHQPKVRLNSRQPDAAGTSGALLAGATQDTPRAIPQGAYNFAHLHITAPSGAQPIQRTRYGLTQSAPSTTTKMSEKRRRQLARMAADYGDHDGDSAGTTEPLMRHAHQPPPPPSERWRQLDEMAEAYGDHDGDSAGTMLPLVEHEHRRHSIGERLEGLESTPDHKHEPNEALETLYGLQTEINHGYRQASDAGLDKEHERFKELQSHSNRLQRLFQKHIGRLAASKEDLRVPGLLPEEQAHAAELWRGLRDGTGAITIANDDAHAGSSTDERPDFRTETLTSFARLMPSRTARGVIDDTMKGGLGGHGGHGVHIAPIDAAGASGIEPGATPESHEQATMLTDMGRMSKHDTYYAMPHQLVGQKPNPNEYRPNVGSSSTISMPRDLRDAHLVGANRKGTSIPLPSPNVLSHELIHANHAQQGILHRSVDDRHLPSHTNKGRTPAEEWSNYEEYATIMKQNRIDAELGLPERWGHSGDLRLTHEEVVRRAKDHGYDELH